MGLSPREDGYLSHLTLGLLSPLAAGLRPWEVGHRDYEEAIACIGDTSQGVVPRKERGKETEEASSHDDRLLGVAQLVMADVANSEQQEGNVQSEEQGEEGDRRLEGAHQQDEGEDEPALEGEISC